jgi:hypothetical protein
MGSLGLAVLAVVLLMGLFLGGLLPWASTLLGTGHPTRRGAKGHQHLAPPDRRVEPGAGRALAGALLAVAVSVLFVLFLVPGSVEGLSEAVDVPGGALTLSFAVLILAIVFALPTWLGVRR